MSHAEISRRGAGKSHGLRRERWIYWAATAVIAALMFWSSINFAFNPAQKDAFRHFGLPDWFRIELTVAKLLGVVALVAPRVPSLVREFAYFGFGLVLVSADIAHLSSGDGIGLAAAHAAFFAILVLSYVYWRRKVGSRQHSA